MIQRGVGLDHMRDRELVRRLDPSLDGADDPSGDGAIESERVPDGDHLVTHVHAVRVAERERLERARLDVHPQDRDICGGIHADDAGLDPLVVREADLDRVRSSNDVIVRDDVSGLVDDEAGTECALRLGGAEWIPEERVLLLRNARGRLDVDDSRGRRPVDLVDREPFALRERRRSGRARCDFLPEDGRLLAELSQSGRATERHSAAQQSSSEEPGGAASEVEGAMHAFSFYRGRS